MLDQVKEMKRRGLTEEQITQQLREWGLKPLEISQALEQSNIKAAVFPEETAERPGELMQTQPSAQGYPEEVTEPFQTESEEMQLSVMNQAQIPQEPMFQQRAEQPTEEAPEYIYPTPQSYEDYPEYQPYQAEMAPEIITEIAESIVEEKTFKIKREINSIKNFQETAERKIKNIDERLKKIEEIIERLQASILGKIGSYGQNLQDIKKEMETMQQSFSKALPSLVEQGKSGTKPETSTSKTQRKSTTKKTTKKKSGIEHYLKR